MPNLHYRLNPAHFSGSAAAARLQPAPLHFAQCGGLETAKSLSLAEFGSAWLNSPRTAEGGAGGLSALSPEFLHYCGFAALTAMLTEVSLSPKPGLVDLEDNGAHKDMGVAEFYRSAQALYPFWPRFILLGAQTAPMPPDAILACLRPLGLAAEAAMLRATGGVNTHKGSIFALGLLCAAIGRLRVSGAPLAPEIICSAAAGFCRGLAQRELSGNGSADRTAGQRLYRQMGLTGARGAAESGWPLAVHKALPHLTAALRAGRPARLALLETLLLLMAENEDTNVAARGGRQGLLWLQNYAKALLQQGGIQDEQDVSALRHFNKLCRARNLSPGGSADLLIIIWFLAQICADAKCDILSK